MYLDNSVVTNRLKPKKEPMEVEYYSEPPRSSEEEDELGRSVKKFKESLGARNFSQPKVSVIKTVWLERYLVPMNKLLSLIRVQRWSMNLIQI